MTGGELASLAGFDGCIMSIRFSRAPATRYRLTDADSALFDPTRLRHSRPSPLPAFEFVGSAY